MKFDLLIEDIQSRNKFNETEMELEWNSAIRQIKEIDVIN